MRVQLTPLTRGEVLGFFALDRAQPDFRSRMLEFYAGLLTKHVQSLTGLADAGNEPITLDTLVRDAYFNKLVADLWLELVLKAAPQNPSPPDSQPIAV